MNFIKNLIPTGGRCAPAKSGDFLVRATLRCSRLALPGMNTLKNVVTVLVITLVAGCSFHSAQWESAKALWATKASATQQGNETFWWDMKYEGETYRLFPVAWNGKSVLMDARRWIIVLQNNEITMIRDLFKNQQISFVDPNRGRGRAFLPYADFAADTSIQSRGEHSKPIKEISISIRPIYVDAHDNKMSIFCKSAQFDSQALRLATRCSFGTQEADFRMAEFDRSGNIITVGVNIPSKGIWTIYRSDDLVDLIGVKRYLEVRMDDV